MLLDYFHLAKRLGAVGASQLPFHYLLTLKSPYSPLQFATGRSYESLLTAHQSLGRIITALFYAHVALFLNFYIRSNLLATKLKQVYILCGVFGTVAFSAIAATAAFQPVRHWNYRLFYLVHVGFATLLLPVLYFHVDHIRPFLYETSAVYAIHAALRFASTKSHPGVIQRIEGTDLVEVRVAVSKGATTWQPGQHAYLSLAGV